MDSELQRVPLVYLRDALHVAEAQTNVPASPGERSGERYDLCLGACLAYASLCQTDGPLAAECFRSELEKAGTSELIAQVLAHSPVGEAAARAMVLLNDSVKPEDRLNAMKTLISLVSAREISA